MSELGFTSDRDAKYDADNWNMESPILILIGLVEQATYEGIHLAERTENLGIRETWIILDLNNYETEFFDVEVEGVVQERVHSIESGLTVSA